MDFENVIKNVVGALECGGIRYALIGGFAMSLRGVQRATIDLDFILMLEDLREADQILQRFGYRRLFHSENISHYQADERAWGRIGILHAFRGPSLGMLKRADLINIGNGLSLRVVQIEDLIGLKVQALVNNPDRTLKDWSDICMMLKTAGEDRIPLDWELIDDYLRLFHLEGILSEMKGLYGTLK
jgi:predicted nucleotidyltransferase